MSRLLLGFSVIQTVALIFLAVKQVDSETRLAALQLTSGSVSASAPPAAYSGANVAIDPSDLRRIIREELAVIAKPGQPAGAIAAAASSRTAPEAAATATPSVASAQQVRVKLASHISRGKMSAAEMDEFLATAAELPAEQRRQVMRELTNAMNSGRLDARM